MAWLFNELYRPQIFYAKQVQFLVFKKLGTQNVLESFSILEYVPTNFYIIRFLANDS